MPRSLDTRGKMLGDMRAKDNCQVLQAPCKEGQNDQPAEEGDIEVKGLGSVGIAKAASYSRAEEAS